jgi:RNA polymerase sigma-70 factor (ECF subfamily)
MVCGFFVRCSDVFARWCIYRYMTRLADINPDPSTLARLASDDIEAQRELYGQLAGPVFALTRRLIRDRAASEDLFQDSMMAVFRHAKDFRGQAPFGAWVRQIVVRRCLMHLRSPWQRARLALGVAEVAEPVQPELPLAELVDLDRALARLSGVARTVLWLHDVEGLTHNEIATTFGRTVSFSKSQLARAHKQLRSQLNEADLPAADHFNDNVVVQGHVL